MSGLDERYYWHEAVFAFSLETRLTSESALQLKLNGMLGSDSYLEVDLRPAGFGLAELELGSIFAQNLSLLYQRKLTPSVHLLIRFAAGHWQFNQSETVLLRSGGRILAVTEPDSRRYQGTAGLGIGVSF